MYFVAALPQTLDNQWHIHPFVCNIHVYQYHVEQYRPGFIGTEYDVELYIQYQGNNYYVYTDVFKSNVEQYRPLL